MELLQALNPQYKQDIIPAAVRTYPLVYPSGRFHASWNRSRRFTTKTRFTCRPPEHSGRIQTTRTRSSANHFVQSPQGRYTWGNCCETRRHGGPVDEMERAEKCKPPSNRPNIKNYPTMTGKRDTIVGRRLRHRRRDCADPPERSDSHRHRRPDFHRRVRLSSQQI